MEENRRALVVGGGISGSAAALVLGRLGYDVSLIEKDPVWSALGSGISLIAPAIRALQRLGLLEQCIESGCVVERIDICGPDSALIESVGLPRAEGSSLPVLLGMMRPKLHDLFAHAVAEQSVEIKLGTTISALEASDEAISIETSDGALERFGLLIAADGLHSSTRDLVQGGQTPTFQRQAVFRAVVPKPAGVDAAGQFRGPHDIHAGFTPTGGTSAYMFCLAPADDRRRLEPDEAAASMRQHLRDFSGLAGEMRDAIGEMGEVDYRPMETLLLPKPWSRGRLAVLGDAAHATTPQLAAGAAMCLEDALALGDELEKSQPTVQALQSFSERRFDRCRFVVERSIALSNAQIRAENEAHGRLFGEAVGILAQEY